MTQLSFTDAIDRIDINKPAVGDALTKLSFGEMRYQAGQVASNLNSQYGSGKYIVLRAPTSISFIVTLLGIQYSGNIPIPVDPQLPISSLEYLLHKSDASAVINPLETEDLVDLAPYYHPSPAKSALVMFTSGTSGYPKGVVISHKNLLHSCESISGYLEYPAYASAAVVLPMFYSYGLLSQVFCMLYSGGFVQLFPDFQNVLAFEKVVNSKSIKTFCGVPSTYLTLVKLHKLKPLKMSHVRVLCSAGAAMNSSILAQLKEIFPNALMFNNYGMTEATPRISYIREDDPSFFEQTCGRPINGLEIKIADPLTNNELPPRAKGIVLIRGPNVTSGYLNDDELNELLFTRDNFLITGDIGYIKDGLLFLLGRNDDIFNVGGEKVAPMEIERVLNNIDEVELSAVTGIADPLRGKVPAAFLKLNRHLTRKSIMEQIMVLLASAKLPAYFYEVSGFPMTSNGKLQRRKLSPDSDLVIRRIT